MKIPRKSLTVALPLFLLLTFAVLAIRYLRSDAFREFAKTSLVSTIERSTGLKCTIDQLQVDVFHGRFAASNLALSERGSRPGLVSLRVPKVSASLGISSFWHFQVRLHELIITRPRLALVSGEGESSWSPEEILRNLKLSLRLEATKVRVEQGLVTLNSSAEPFNLSLDDLDFEIRYSKRLPSYRVHIKYGASRIFWEKRDILHGLELNADVSLQGIVIESFKFRRSVAGTDTILTGTGSLENWKSPVLLIHTTGTLDCRDLILATPTLFEGRGNIAIAADLRQDNRGIYSKGTFSSMSGSYRKMSYGNLSGSYEILKDVLRLRNVTGKIANGSFIVNTEIQLRQSNKDPNRVIVLAKNVPIIEAGRLLDLPLLNFENSADSNTVLTWYGGRELRADCDAVLHALPKPLTNFGRSTLLDGSLKFTYFESGTLIIENANLLSPYTTVQASGGQGSVFRVQLSTSRIAEPFDLIANFSPPVSDLIRRQPDVRDIRGRFDFDGNVGINSATDIDYRGSFAIKDGRWRSYKLDTLSSVAVFRPPSLELNSLSVRSGPQALDGDLNLELADGERLSRFGFKGTVRQVSLASLGDFGFDASDMRGSVSGSGSVRLERDSWEGEGQVSIEKGSYKGEPFDTARAQLILGGQKIRILKAEARRGSARISAEGQIDLESRALRATTRLQGLSVEELPVIAKKGAAARGHIDGSGLVSGTVEKPVFSGDFELTSLQYRTWNFGNGKGHIDFENGTLKGTASLKSELGNLRFQGSVAMRSGYPGRAAMDFSGLDVQKIVSEKPPSFLEEISTALEGKLEGEGNFADPSSIRVRGEVDGAHFKIHGHALQNVGRMRFTIQNGNLRIESARFTGEGTNLSVSGTIPFDDSPDLDIGLNGTLDLSLLAGFEKKLSSEGAATLNIRATGTKREPQVIGQASFRNAKLDYEALPFRFSGMQGDIVFSRNLVRLENVRGSAASGFVQVSGTIEHQNAMLRSINMSISMRNARMPYPKDFRSVANAELVLSGTADAQILSGEIDVTRMEYVRSFNLLEQLASHSVSQSGPLTTEPYLLGLRLNLDIRSDNGLSIDNELTRLHGSMRLMLRGTPAYPSLTGRVEASEGTIFFRGSRFEISHAAADFVDRSRINPVLEIRAEADVKTYRLILDAVGDLEHLNLNVSSDPPMSTVDILSLLTTGKTEATNATSTAAATSSQRESQMAGMSAASVLSENLTGVIGKRVQRIFGLESFRVDPFLAGAENDPTARITLSERLSKDLVVTFSRNLTTNQEQIVVIEYDVGKNVSMVATRDEDGKFGLDFRFRKRLR